MSRKKPNSQSKPRSNRRTAKAGHVSAGRPKQGAKVNKNKVIKNKVAKKAARVCAPGTTDKARPNTANSKSTAKSKSAYKTVSKRPDSRAGVSKNASNSSLSDRKPARNNVDRTNISHTAEVKLNTKPYYIEVDIEHAGQRIDNFLVTRLKGVPKAHIYRVIRKGEVRVNKGRVKQTTRLQESDMVRIPPIRLADQSIKDLDGSRYEFLRKTVLFEDDALLVINKPSGMAVHAGSGIKVGVIEALRVLRTDLNYLELVHRLDRETSGCLVLAKKSSALKILHEDFKTNSLKNKKLDKRYMALVQGSWKFGQRRITKPLNTDARRHGERYVVVDEAGSYASSIVTPIDVSDAASLIEVKLLTGRTHQVRVHTLSEGHPIAGDQRYGDLDFNKLAKKHKLSRLFLHASRLSFNHPLLGEPVTISAKLPDDLQAVIASFKLCTN